MATFNMEKFQQLLHYIIQKCGNLRNIGKTTLYKILYFCDFDYYELFETPITSEDYVKLLHGPAPVHFAKAIGNLRAKKLIKTEKVVYHGRDQQKFLSLSEPNLSKLSAQEKQLVDKVTKKLGGMNATQISEYSHRDMPWQATEKNDIIDYNLVFYRDKLMSVREYLKK